MTRGFLSLRFFWFRYSLTRAANRAAIADSIAGSVSRHPAGKGKA